MRDAAAAYAQERLAPRVLEAFRHEWTDPAIFREMGELGLLGATIPEAYGDWSPHRPTRWNYAACTLIRAHGVGASLALCCSLRRTSAGDAIDVGWNLAPPNFRAPLGLSTAIHQCTPIAGGETASLLGPNLKATAVSQRLPFTAQRTVCASVQTG